MIRARRRLLRLGVAMAAGLALAASLLWLYLSRASPMDTGPLLIHATLEAWRRESPLCPRWQAMLGLWEEHRTLQAGAKMYPQTRLVRSDSQGYQLWQSPVGQWWFPGNTSENNIRFALTQYKVTAYPGLRLRPGAVVLDCGGYVGDWAHWALQHGAARVIVFEPASAQLECIRRNLSEFIRQGKVTLIPKGVWDQPGTLTLNIVPDNPAANSVSESPAAQSETIELTTIDAVVEELKLDRLDAIKMDIEGAEVRALRGARRTLARFRPQLAVATEHTADKEQNNRDVIQTMRETAPGYRMRCGFCGLSRDQRRIVPETLYFYPD